MCYVKLCTKTKCLKQLTSLPNHLFMKDDFSLGPFSYLRSHWSYYKKLKTKYPGFLVSTPSKTGWKPTQTRLKDLTLCLPSYHQRLPHPLPFSTHYIDVVPFQRSYLLGSPRGISLLFPSHPCDLVVPPVVVGAGGGPGTTRRLDTDRYIPRVSQVPCRRVILGRVNTEILPLSHFLRRLLTWH